MQGWKHFLVNLPHRVFSDPYCPSAVHHPCLQDPQTFIPNQCSPYQSDLINCNELSHKIHSSHLIPITAWQNQSLSLLEGPRTISWLGCSFFKIMKWIIHTEQFKVLLYYYSVNNKNITGPLGTDCVPSSHMPLPLSPQPHPEVTTIPPSVLIIPQLLLVDLHLWMKIQITGFILENEIAAWSYMCPC